MEMTFSFTEWAFLRMGYALTPLVLRSSFPALKFFSFLIFRPLELNLFSSIKFVVEGKIRFHLFETPAELWSIDTDLRMKEGRKMHLPIPGNQMGIGSISLFIFCKQNQ